MSWDLRYVRHARQRAQAASPSSSCKRRQPIPQQQLAEEVKSIYAGLTMVESKCIHVDKSKAKAIRNDASGSGGSKLINDGWQALIALHRTLLHEHHDFFLASQQPSASPAFRRLCSEHLMLSRIWKPAIPSFLELLRYRLPDPPEFMIAFIHIAYQMTSLLYETILAFEDAWIECLGDLGRYRMAIENEDVRDRKSWARVAQFWSTKAVDRSPDVGRLYRHLAILAGPNALQHLYHRSRSWTSTQPFHSARGFLLTLFDLVPNCSESVTSTINTPDIDTRFIDSHAISFSRKALLHYDHLEKSFLNALDTRIQAITTKWKEQGAYVIIANLGAFNDYGAGSPVRHLFNRGISNSEAPTGLAPCPLMDMANWEAYHPTSSLIFNRIGDELSSPVPLSSLPSYDVQGCESHVADFAILNKLSTLSLPSSRSVDFIPPEQGGARPLPEDHLIRGQVWSQGYFPENWFLESECFHESEVEDESWIEYASIRHVKVECMVLISTRLAIYKNLIVQHEDETPLLLQDPADQSSQVRTESSSFTPSIDFNLNSHEPSRRYRWYALRKFSSWLMRPRRSATVNTFNRYAAILMSFASSFVEGVDTPSTITASQGIKPIDFAGTIFGASFFLGVQIVGKRADPFAWGVMTATSVAWVTFHSDTRFPIASQWQVLQIWLFSYGAYIVSKYRHLPMPQVKQYIIIAFLLSMVFELIGMALQNYVPEAMSKAAPPSLALGSTLATYLIRGRAPPDLERGNMDPPGRALGRRSRARETINTPIASRASPQRSLLSRTPATPPTPAQHQQPRPAQVASTYSARSPLPSPDAFTIGDSETEDDVLDTQPGGTTRAP